jgi:hypothetical protein
MPTSWLFRVTIPFEPYVHETIDSRIQSALPDVSLAGMKISHSGEDQYLAVLEVRADRPRTAKVDAVTQVERLLKLLAAWNDSFTVRVAGVTAERIEETTGGAAAGMAEVVFAEEHVALVKVKGTLAREDAALARFNELPQHTRNCVDLNYLLVISDRPQVRWLLAATGLEALTLGHLGRQPRLAGRLRPGAKRQLRQAIDALLRDAGVVDQADRDRAFPRLLDTTLEPLAGHVSRYLASADIEDVTVADLQRWWEIRGKIAHGSAVEIDDPDLNKLIGTFQAALRRAA